jgi:hypothetical protein
VRGALDSVRDRTCDLLERRRGASESRTSSEGVSVATDRCDGRANARTAFSRAAWLLRGLGLPRRGGHSSPVHARRAVRMCGVRLSVAEFDQNLEQPEAGAAVELGADVGGEPAAPWRPLCSSARFERRAAG